MPSGGNVLVGNNNSLNVRHRTEQVFSNASIVPRISYCPPYCRPGCGRSKYSESCSSICEEFKDPKGPFFLKELKCCGKGSADPLCSKFALPTVPVPSWIGYCGAILKFFGYFQEPIPESPLETYRIHRCEIRYYLEDDTIEVVEPKTFDPGYIQGRLINRGRIHLPPPCDDSYFTMEHFNVGCEVTLYGKTFHICGCDQFTRDFLNKLGIAVMQDSEVPCDPATVKRQDIVTSQFGKKSGIHLERIKREKYIVNNRKVLRFWGHWDDRCTPYGFLRHFVINYYLEDDTLGITEILKSNTGVDEGFSTFLSRSKIPKDPNHLVPLPGVKEEALLVLNVVGGENGCAYTTPTFISDRLCPGLNEPEYYKDSDLAIGATLNIYGRCFILTDCDEFTKVYYKEKYGVENFTPLELAEPKYMLPKMETPPHVGIGDEEDTFINWNRIERKPPKKDVAFMILNDKNILGFSAQLSKTLQCVNSARRFVIRFFMSDGSLQIFEKDHPNTGLGKRFFLNRMRVVKPIRSEIKTSGKLPDYFTAQDFFIGAILNINGFQFVITDADEFTLCYMEHNFLQFPHSNVCSVLNKMREACGPMQAADILLAFTEKDTCRQGVIDCSDFRELVLKISKCALSEHEVITLKRAYKAQAPDPGPDIETLKTVIRTELKRFHFDKKLIERLEYTLRYHDPCRCGTVDKETLRATLAGAKLPIARDLRDFFVDNFPCTDTCGRINYIDVIKFLDWETNGGLDALPSAVPCILKWVEPKPPPEIKCVNYRAFLEDICPNFKCALPLVCCSEKDCGAVCGECPQACEPNLINCEPCDANNGGCQEQEQCEDPHEGWDEFYG